MSAQTRLIIRVLLIISTLGFLAQEAFAEDPGAMGSFAVSTQEYDYGDSAFQPTGFPIPVELRGDVHYPTDLSKGPFPLVIFMHGAHNTCYDNEQDYFQWPCDPGRSPLPSYRGYDYAANVLASHGYIVVSISANGISTHDNQTDDGGMNARAQLLQRHLDQWKTFNAGGAGSFVDGRSFGSLFVGKVDMNNIGTMGHSRGGEGVARYISYNRTQPSPYNVRAALLLAPSNDNRELVENVALGVVLPYCDGDLIDLQGVHYYDDARYSSANDATPKHSFLVMGANHNFYNTVWTPGLFPVGTSDDWRTTTPPGIDPLLYPSLTPDPYCGASSQRLSDAEQRRTGITLITAFFRTYLGHEKQFMDILTGDVAPPPSATTATIHASYHPASNKRLDINRLDSKSREIINSLGGATSQVGLSTYDICGADSSEAKCLAEPDQRQPHTSNFNTLNNKLGLSQLKLRWDNNGDWYENQLPVGQHNIRAYGVLQFRVGVNFVDSPMGQTQDFEIELRDGAGARASVLVSRYSNALFYPPGDPSRIFFINSYALGNSFENPVPRLFLNTVRIPLSQFKGVDLSNITAIRFNFNQTPQGAVMISDLALAKDEKLPPWLIPVIDSVLK